jgi:rhodanese-related sulfurtransferase
MADTISMDELRTKIERGDRFHLFEVLAPMYFRKHHLPGAKNLPPAEVRERIVELVPDRRDEIVVYCWDDG